MSLLESILSKKSNLKPNITRITTVSGQVFTERTTPGGDREQIEINERSQGFVVDNTPDTQVAVLFPWLCLGSQDVTCDLEILRLNQISCVLSLGVSPPVQFPNINYMFLPVYDEPGYNLSQHFAQCFTFIDRCHDNKQVIFVHCNAGVSRSATIVIAYVMKHLRLDLAKAIDMVKMVRPCIKPNQGFMQQLKEWEKTLKESCDAL